MYAVSIYKRVVLSFYFLFFIIDYRTSIQIFKSSLILIFKNNSIKRDSSLLTLLN